MLSRLAPQVENPPSPSSAAWTASTTPMASVAESGPSTIATAPAASKCPDVPWSTGKLIICAAKIAAPAAASDWHPCASSERRACHKLAPQAAADAAEVIAQTGSLRKPPGMCISSFLGLAEAAAKPNRTSPPDSCAGPLAIWPQPRISPMSSILASKHSCSLPAGLDGRDVWPSPLQCALSRSLWVTELSDPRLRRADASWKSAAR